MRSDESVLALSRRLAGFLLYRQQDMVDEGNCEHNDIPYWFGHPFILPNDVTNGPFSCRQAEQDDYAPTVSDMAKTQGKGSEEGMTKVALKLITSGHVFSLVVLVLGGGVVWKLKSADLASTIKEGIHSPLALVLGWTLATTFFVLGAFIIRLQRDFYLREIARLNSELKPLASTVNQVLPSTQSGVSNPSGVTVSAASQLLS